MPYSTFPLRKNERIFLQIQHFMSEYSASIYISWGNPLCFLYFIEKAQLLQAAPSHPIFYAHAYFFLCSITPASSARSICASSCASPSNAVCCGSPSRILSVLRISLGITTLPNSSMRRTIPVARTNIASFYSAFYPLSQYGCRPSGIFHLERWQRLTGCVSFTSSIRV